MGDYSGQSQDGPSQQQVGSVDQQQEVPPFPLGRRPFDLMILETEITKLSVVSLDLVCKPDHPRFVPVDLVRLDEPFGQLDDLAEGPLLSGRLVQSSTGVNNHQGLGVRGPDRHGLQSIVDQFQQLSTSFSLHRAALIKQVDELARHLDRGSEFDDSSRPELVRMKIRKSDRDDLDLEILVLRHGSERHYRDPSFERQEIRSIVRSSFGEDSDGTVLVETLVDVSVDLVLINIG